MGAWIRFWPGCLFACAVAKVLHQGRMETYMRVDPYSHGVRSFLEEGGGYVYRGALLPESYTTGGGWIHTVMGCVVARRRGEGTIRVRFARRRVEGTSRGVRCCQEEGGGYERGALLPESYTTGGGWIHKVMGCVLPGGGWRVRIEACVVARRRVEGTRGVRCCQSLTPQEEGGYIKSWGAFLPGGRWRVR